MHETIKTSNLVKISEPRNNFPLVPAKKVLLMAGGIGVTPIVCMAEWLWHTGVKFEMHYCTRSPQRTAFRDRIMSSAFAHAVTFHYDDGEQAQKLDLTNVLRRPSDDKHLYVCGPSGFITSVSTNAKTQGWLDRNVHWEYFGSANQASSLDVEFQVKILSTGEMITIPPNQSVTTALARHGIDIPVSCELGVCGTCLTQVCEGEPDHRDLYMTDEARGRNDFFTPCCSRAKSRVLVLKL